MLSVIFIFTLCLLNFFFGHHIGCEYMRFKNSISEDSNKILVLYISEKIHGGNINEAKEEVLKFFEHKMKMWKIK